ncbi:type II toxin-antitoxin system RelE/ParE family toxin [Verminephrobacter aporrectodeae]
MLRDNCEGRLPEVLKRKNLARWQLSERLPDVVPCKVVREREEGLIDADLGGPSLQEARGARWRRQARRLLHRPGSDRQPVRVPAWVPEEHHGERSRRAGRQALQYTGRVFLDLSAAARVKALQAGALLEVHCGEQDH